ncbi:MAG: glycosyltransferase family 39 protein [Phycisphaerae bacterium]|nr:glycosyltransferase family 39 protein [Phycisphaerae bacterium]
MSSDNRQPARTLAATASPDAAREILLHLAILTMISSVAMFLRLDRAELMGAREPKAITPARQMLQSGDWVLPRLGNRPRLEKPPWVYWRIAALGAWTGHVGRWEGRLPGAIEGVLLVLLCYALGRSLLGPAVGLASACFLIATPAFVYEARLAGPDTPFTLLATLAVAAAWWSWNSPSRRRRLGLLIVFYISLSLAALCKGPFVLVNCGLPILAFVIWRRKPILLWRLNPILGLLIVIAIVAPWPVLLWKHGVDPRSLWGREVAQKLHPDPFKSLQYLMGRIFPWIPLFLGGLTVPFLKRHRAFPREVLMPWVWFVSVFAGVSLLFSAKENYLSALAVPAALLIGTCWCGMVRLFREKTAGWQERLVLHGQIGVLGVGGIVAAAVLAHKFGRGVLEPTIIAACFVVAAVGMAVFYRREKLGAQVPAMCCVLAMGVLTAGYIPTIAAHRSMGGPARQLVKYLRTLPPDAPVYDYVKQCAFVYYHLDHPLPRLPGPKSLGKHLSKTKEPFYLAMQWQLAGRDHHWRVPMRRGETVEWVDVKERFEEVEAYWRPHQHRPAVVLLRYKGPPPEEHTTRQNQDAAPSSATPPPPPPGQT